MFGTSRSVRSLLAGLVASCAVIVAASSCFADKLYLKDGRVLDGKVVKKTAAFIYFKVTGNAKEDLFDLANVDKVVEDKTDPAPPTTPADPKTDAPKTDAPKTDAPKTGDTAKPADGAKVADPKARSASKIPRIAILNFGPPQDWQGRVEDTVGIEITAKAWKEAIPLLEKDNVTDVVVRINSGGGALSEMEPFQMTYENMYKPRFRLVGWVESAISCAAMSPWVIEEFYFFPNGNIGACTGWSGNLVAMKGLGLEMVKIQMEKASRMGKRDPKIMLSMQVMEPLSCNIDPETGAVSWFQDLSGSYILNPGTRILTLTAQEAIKYKFGKGIASTKEELARVMGYTEFEFGGAKAAKYIDDMMTLNDTNNKKFEDYYAKYEITVGAARQLQDKPRRLMEVGQARKHLGEMEAAYKVNPTIGQRHGVDPDWFKAQEQLLKDLSK